jgi:hypothetical protein
MKHRAIALTLALWSLVVLGWASGARADEAKVRVVGLSIAEADPDSKFGQSMVPGLQAGTQVHVMISELGKHILGIDEDASSIKTMADDKGNALKPKATGLLGPFPKISPDARRLVIEARSKDVPAEGGKQIHIAGQIAVQVGSDEKTKLVEMPLKAEAKVELGPVKATVSEVADARWGQSKVAVTLKSPSPLRAIKELTFLDADGKKIEHSQMSSGASGWGGKKTYTVTYGLAKKVDSVSVKVVWFTRTDTITVPLDLNVSVGL